jgi:hypothetical protein
MCSLPINVASSIDLSGARRRCFRVSASAQMSTPRDLVPRRRSIATLRQRLEPAEGESGKLESKRSCLWSYVAPHNAKIRTEIARSRPDFAKCRILKALKPRPFGFDSHRPLHFPATFQQSTWRSIRFGSNRLRERSIRAARRPSTISMRAENVLCIAF